MIWTGTSKDAGIQAKAVHIGPSSAPSSTSSFPCCPSLSDRFTAGWSSLVRITDWQQAVQKIVYVDSFTPDACILRCACFIHQPCELLNVVPSLNGTILLHLEVPLFSFILCSSCWILLLIPLWRLPFVDGHFMVTQPIALLESFYMDYKLKDLWINDYRTNHLSFHYFL